MCGGVDLELADGGGWEMGQIDKRITTSKQASEQERWANEWIINMDVEVNILFVLWVKMRRAKSWRDDWISGQKKMNQRIIIRRNEMNTWTRQ